jgi:hypothetical protein
MKYYKKQYNPRGWDCVDGTATRYWLDDTGFEPRRKQETFSSPKFFGASPRAQTASYLVHIGVLTVGKGAGAWRRSPTPIYRRG